MKPLLLSTLFLCIVFIMACQKGERSMATKEASTASESFDTEAGKEGGFQVQQNSGNFINGFISSLAALETGQDTSRKFIREADVKFRVKNVYASTLNIEDITRRFNGFVAHTHLQTEIDHTSITPISADSSLESTYYTVTNTLTLRVPSLKLDSALKAIATHIDFLHYRTISAEDVALKLLADRLTQRRVSKHTGRLENDIDKGKNKLGDATIAEETLMNREAQADAARLNSLTLMDRVRYSTITLNIYQRETVQRTLIPNDKNIGAYQPSFFAQVWEALKTGWAGLKELCIVLLRLWPLLALLVLVIFIYRRYFRGA